jgi:hypothetical protein
MNNNAVLTRMHVILGIVSLVFLAGCGGSTASTVNNQPPPPTVTLTASAANIAIGQSDMLTTSATEASSCTLSGPTNSGSVPCNGSFSVTPNMAGVATYTATATGPGGTSAPASVTITVNETVTSVTVSPATAILQTGGTQRFIATVNPPGATQAVTWAVQEGAAGGRIAADGFYTAPTMVGTFHVAATSAADPSKSASVPVVVSQPVGSFTTTASMLKVVGIHTATLLADGKVLVAGGSEGTFNYAYGGLPDAELYDPVARSFIATSSMTSARTLHTASLLPNGKVLVTGGFDEGRPDQPLPESSAELYDPATGSFTPAGTMGIARAVHTATLLPNGKVLIAGGGTEEIVDGGFPFFGPGIAESEVYDPATNSFAPAGAMGSPRYAHTATLLPNGKVLITGGFSTSDSSAGAPQALLMAELYDPATGTFNPTGNMGTPRGGHTATLMPDGKVLISGGLMSIDATATAPSAELYDPATGAFAPTGSMAEARAEHTATLLPDGRVLIVGGYSVTAALTSAEIYDPRTGSFAFAGSMAEARAEHTATLLPDGTVLVAGGNSMPTGTAEIFRELP